MSYEEQARNRDDIKREEWIILTDLKKPFHDEVQNEPCAENFDWQSDRLKYTAQQIEEMTEISGDLFQVPFVGIVRQFCENTNSFIVT